MKRLRLLPFVVLIALLASYVGATGQSGAAKQDDKQEKQSLVTQKLDHAQKVLAAVAQTDYQMVEKHAEALIKNSKALAWTKVRSERYDELGNEYRRDLEGLIKAAKAKSNDAMALAYVRMSLACFNCHNHVREFKIAD
jgi:hypothetical protein